MKYILILIVIALAVVYWPVTLCLAALGVVALLVAGRRRQLLARAIAALPAAPNRMAGPVRWRGGVLELTPAGLAVTRVALRGGSAVSSIAVIPRDRIMAACTATTGDRGIVLTIVAKGGNHAYGRIEGDAVPLLDGLGVPVTEDGVRWTRTAAARRRVPLRPTRCATCGAPVAPGSSACPYCHHAMA